MPDPRVKDLLAEIARLKAENTELKTSKPYGLVWEDKPEQFETDAENAVPVLECKGGRFKDITLDPASDHNVLIEGDNYHALSVLNYTHRGKIDVIYIDPPYNTGNKDFRYNDAFVEADDLYRHSKWLSFMAKRLRIAASLLTEDGLIFISIGDDEVAQLKLLCNAIFGEHNFVTTFIWEKTQHFGRQKVNFYSNADNILVYASNLNANGRKELLVERIKQEHEDAPLFNASNPVSTLSFPPGTVRFNIPDGKYTQSNDEKYQLTVPVTVTDATNKTILEIRFRSRWSQRKVDEQIRLGAKFWVKSTNFAVRAIYPDDKRSNDSPKQIIFTNARNEFLAKSRFDRKVGVNEEASAELLEILGTQTIFEYPKPVSLVSYLISLLFNQATDNFRDNITILDFFAGSGTTGHAVLELNKDGGDRRFILCTNNENGIAEDVTYERLKRVMKGYKTPKGDSVDGLGGNLAYLKTAFVKKELPVGLSDEAKLELTRRANLILALRDNTFTPVREADRYYISKSPTHLTGIYFSEDKRNLTDLLDELTKLAAPGTLTVTVYIFSWDKGAYKTGIPGYPFDFQDIPEPLVEVYASIGL